jgi:hypothetical protein
MLRAVAAAIAVVFSGCGGAGAFNVTHRVALATAATTLACDWAGTRSMSAADWPDRTYESNPVMGRHPEPLTVDLYFLAAFAVATGAWYALPRRWKLTVPIVVGTLGVQSSIHNVTRDVGICGVR